MSDPIKPRDHLWLMSVFGSEDERAKAEMPARGDRVGEMRSDNVVFFFCRGISIKLTAFCFEQHDGAAVRAAASMKGGWWFNTCTLTNDCRCWAP